MDAQLVMIPVALLAGSLADRKGRRLLLMVAFLALPIRAAISAFVDDPVWLIAAKILDGVGSGIVGVAVPVVVADLTWGSSRTQTALASINAHQGVGGAVSAGFGGLAQGCVGWSGAFLALGAASLFALALVIWLNSTAEDNPRAERSAAAARKVRKHVRTVRRKTTGKPSGGPSGGASPRVVDRAPTIA